MILTALVASSGARAEPLTVSGVVDTYFAFDLDRPANNERPPFLYSYARTNEVNVNLAMVHLAWLDGPVRANAGLMAGTFPQYNQLFEQEMLRHLYEANAGVRVAPRLWVDAGLFPSHLGAESAIGPDNLTPTRSLMAENSPYYLAGAKATWEVSDAVTVVALAANGWQTIRQPVGRDGGGGGTQLVVQVVDGVTVNWSTWVGAQPEGAVRAFNDVYVTVEGGRLELVAWVDVGVQDGTWGGATLLGRVRLTENLAVGARAEHYRDREGIIVTVGDQGVVLTGASAHVDVWPISARWTDTPPAVWRLEARGFQADRAVFGDGAGGPHLNAAFTTSLAVRF